MARKNLSMDDDAAELLDDYDGNQSELVSALVKEYFTQGVYDEELAARRRRKKMLEARVEEREAEIAEMRDELDALHDLEDPDTESSIEELARELEITDVEKIHANNGAIVKKAERNGVSPDVLAEEVMQQYQARQAAELASVSADD